LTLLISAYTGIGTARAAAEVAGQLIVAIKAQLTTADKEALIAAAGSAETSIP
jgi:hypothetical protein